MAQLAQAKIQDTTTSSLSGLLSIAKANVNVSGSTSGLFASLLTQAGSSLPVVEAYDASSSSSSSMSKALPKTEAYDSSRQTTQRDTTQASAVSSSAPSKTTSRADSSASAKQETSENDVAAQDNSVKQDVQDQSAAKEDAAPAQDQAQAQATDDTADQAKEDKTATDAVDDQMAALLAAMVVPEKQKSVAKSDEVDVSSLASADGETQVPTEAPAEDLMASIPLPTEEKLAQKTKTAEVGTTAGTQTKATLAATLAQTTGATTDLKSQDDRLGETATVDEDAETTSQYAKMIDEASTATVGNSKKSEQGSQQDFSDLMKGQDQTAARQDATALAGVATSSQTATAAQAGTSEGGVQALGASTSASQNVTALATGTRPVGSYDFASQLSAARVTKGGSTNLPQAVEQVAVQLHKAAKEGADEITIQLRPAELGKIEVKLEIAADKSVTGTVIADSQATLNLLQKDSSSLQRALQEAGLQADSGCMQFSLRDDNQANQFAQNQNQNESWKTGVTAENGLNDSEDLSTLTAATETYYLTPGRVNLRV